MMEQVQKRNKVMELKFGDIKKMDKCCGGCNHFKYETTDGSGWCEVGDTKTYCGFGTDCNDFEDVETIRMERVARKGGLNMTIEELKKIPFHFVSHLSMEDEHCTTYISDDKRFGFCDHVPFKDGHPNREKKAYRHYMILGKVYETKEEFLDALKNIGSMEVIKGGKYEETH